MDRREIAGKICIMGALYRNEVGFFGHPLWRNFVSVLALLGLWPETPLAGEVLKDLGLPDVPGSCVKGLFGSDPSTLEQALLHGNVELLSLSRGTA